MAENTRHRRRRRVDTGATERQKSVPDEARRLMRAVYTENKEKNKHQRAHDSARKELFSLMLDKNQSRYEAQLEVDGSRKGVEAVIARPDVTEVDVAKLRQLVSDDVFMQIVSASQSAIKEIAGEKVAAQCTKRIAEGGNPNVTVRLIK